LTFREYGTVELAQVEKKKNENQNPAEATEREEGLNGREGDG